MIVCPDSWCEGAWSFQFTSFRCPPGANMMPCTLGARAQSNDTAGLSREIDLEVSALAAQRDAQGRLTGAFYEEINRVISQWEQTEGAALLSPPSGSPAGAGANPVAPDPTQQGQLPPPPP